MSTTVFVIVGVSIAAVVGLFVFGKCMDKGDDSK